MYTAVNMMQKGHRSGLVDKHTGEATVELDTPNAFAAYLPKALNALGYGRKIPLFSAFTETKIIPNHELDLWNELTADGDLHEYMAAIAGTSVEASKMALNKAINCRSGMRWGQTADGRAAGDTFKVYKHFFPTIIRAIRKLQKEQPGALGLELTRIEKQIIRQLLPRRAIKLGLAFADIHDGIQCLESQADRLMDLLMDCTNKVIGRCVRIKRKGSHRAATPTTAPAFAPSFFSFLSPASPLYHISGAGGSTPPRPPPLARWRTVFDQLFPPLTTQYDAYFDAWLAEVRAECAC
jgi:hypothetical protein